MRVGNIGKAGSLPSTRQAPLVSIYIDNINGEAEEVRAKVPRKHANSAISLNQS